MTTLRLTLRSEAELAAGARSSLYLRLARAFAFPTPEQVEQIASGGFVAGLRSEAELLPFEFALELEEEGALADCGPTSEDVEQEYIRLFEVGVGRPPCPLYEGSHRNGRMKIMEEAVRFYEHFGLRPDPRDQPDHLCAELEFMHYLAFKEAAAASAGGPQVAFVLGQRDFLDRHLCRWLPLLRARVEKCAGMPLFASLVGVAERFCKLDLDALKKRGAKPDAQIGLLPD